MSSDENDGDLIFKLVDNPARPKHFVVCEIVAPLKLQAPAIGSHVRVYGVSRYDAESGHRWFEVHPVMSIANMR